MNNKLFYTAGFTDMKPRLMHNATPFQVVPQEAQIPETPEAKEKKEAERKKNAADKVSL